MEMIYGLSSSVSQLRVTQGYIFAVNIKKILKTWYHASFVINRKLILF